MELKQVKKGDEIRRPGDGRLIGYATADGIQIHVEPHEIATFKRCFLITDIQLVQAIGRKSFRCPIQIQMEPVE
jgi:hypothetical protein